MEGRPMKRVLLACLLLASVCAFARQRTVKVRLFWLHPPAKIRVVPQSAWIRLCAKCAAKKIRSPVEFSAASGVSREIVGRARISGDGFAPFAIDGELAIQSRGNVLLLTYMMPLEEYVVAVLQGESATFKSEEALKAMAVAARTYAVRFGSRHKAEDFDFCDTTHCQDVRLGNESQPVRAAVVATEGELLWYQGRPAATYYHRSCGGEIESASLFEPDLRVPYLREHHDDYCSRADEWQSEIARLDLKRIFGGAGPSTVRVVDRTSSGRVRSLQLGSRTLPATDFRLTIGRTLGWDKIRSDLFQIEDRGDRIVFRGRGQGHGVGLCQAGAESMGEQGKSYREILAYYYPGTALGLTAAGLGWERLPGEAVDIVTTNKHDTATLMPAADRAFRFAVERVAWSVSGRPNVKVYPTIAIYRDATGEPGWVAASTRGNTIRLQPIAMLQRTGTLESTLRHEFLHMVLESQARPDTPLWLREGLAIYLSNPDSVKPARVDVASLERRMRTPKTEAEMRAAYRESAAAVADAVQKYGKEAVMQWVKNGVGAEYQ
jgi:stage II sporulation protein D